MKQMVQNTNIEKFGWSLVSAVERNKEFPDTFSIPSKEKRCSLQSGAAVKVLFDIEMKERGIVIDRGVDRMWIIVISVRGDQYEGVLDSDPGTAENLKLRRGDLIKFKEEHICQIDHPPTDYLANQYPQYFSGTTNPQ